MATMAEIDSSSSSSAARDAPIEMTDRKVHTVVADMAIDEKVDDADPDFAGTKSTVEDKLQMERLGKKQQLIVSLQYPTVHV